MSYARFCAAERADRDDREASDVYVYFDVCGKLCCCGCLFADEPWVSCWFDSTRALLAHLGEHAAAGHAIPSYTIPSLERDAAENDEWAAKAAVS